MSGAPTRIICVGNRLLEQDAAGPLVHDELSGLALPAGVDLIDGGLAGLDLLRCLEGCRRAVFVDAAEIQDAPPGAYLLDARAIADQADSHYDHAAGLGYLLRLLPLVYGDQAPAVSLVGVQGPATSEVIAAAAAAALRESVPAETTEPEANR